MRLTIFLALFLLPKFSIGQTHIQRPQKKPDKDPIMVIDKLSPGKSRHYSWDNNTIKFTIGGDGDDCRKINVSFNSKPILQHHCIGKGKSFNLKLNKKTNLMVLATDRGNATDTTFASITLTGGAMSYTIQAMCGKRANDTIFIKYK